MKRLLVLALLLGSAHAAIYTTDGLLSPLLSTSPAVQAAATAQSQARTALERLKADPLALRPDTLDAEGRLAVAEGELRLSRIEARQTLHDALKGWQEAQAGVSVAAKSAELAQTKSAAAQARLRAGAITALDAGRARDEQEAALEELNAARASQAAAETALRALLGRLPAPAIRVSLPWITLDGLRRGLAGHPQAITARNRVQAAELRLTIVSSDLSPRAEVERARAELDAARQGATEVTRRLSQGLDAAWRRYGQARDRLPALERSRTAAQERVKVQQGRLARGVASRLDVLEAELAARQAESAFEAAQMAAEGALISAGMAAGLDPWDRER